MNYYNEIKNTFIKNESYKRVKDYSKNKSDLNAYFEVGRLLVEAQGGEARAKYGNKLIKEYSKRLTQELGRGYTETNLRYMRQFFVTFQNHHTLCDELTWSHYRTILSLRSIDEINYYIYICKTQNLSVRDLRERIKSKEYDRTPYKVELERIKIDTLIKNPIIIKANKLDENISEYTLHQLILEDMDNFLKELGVGFTYYGHEVRIKIGDNYHYIDFLLFNYKFNCFIVIELKTTKMKAEYIGQVLKYINYVDKHVKELYHEKTVGVVIVRKEDRFVLEYCSDNRIFTTTYEIETI